MSVSAAFTFAAGSVELRQLLAACDNQPVTPWQAEFLTSIRERRNPPTEKQWTILRSIAAGTPDYELIRAASIRALLEILPRWLPGGNQRGHEYVALNPKRGDHTAGSFSVNTSTGRWADFATGERGGDLISLAAWLFDLAQPEAARRVASMLGMSIGGVSHG